MGHLEDGAVESVHSIEQMPLGLLQHVPGEEQADVPADQPDDHGVVVRVGLRPPEQVPRRVKHLHHHVLREDDRLARPGVHDFGVLLLECPL